MNRIQRIIRLITMLQHGSSNSAGELADELGVSRRTLFRDLKLLDEAGIHYSYTPTQGYRIEADHYLPPVSLSVPETLALMLLGKTVSARAGRPYDGAAMSAIEKLTGTVPPAIREACEDMMASISIDPGAKPIREGTDATYMLLQRCIDEGRVCRMTYSAASPDEDQPLDCELEPLALHFATRAWYVLGRTDQHREVRTFKLSRIRSLQATDRFFQKEPSFRVQDKLGKAWQLIPEGVEYDIELLFSRKVAQNVSEIRWHATQRDEMLPDGRCRMTFTVDGLREMAWWLCGYGGEVRVIEPQALRELVVDMHRDAMRANDGNPDDETAHAEVATKNPGSHTVRERRTPHTRTGLPGLFPGSD